MFQLHDPTAEQRKQVQNGTRLFQGDSLLGRLRDGMGTRLAPCGPSRGCHQLADEALGRLSRSLVLTLRTRAA